MDSGALTEIALDKDEQPVQGRLPDRGCNVEFTEIRLENGAALSTLGFEAFGPLDAVEENLKQTVRLMGQRQPPRSFGASRAWSYPKWLETIKM